MARLRIVTWNCRSGSADDRLTELAPFEPHIVFLQECRPPERAQEFRTVCWRAINKQKAIVLVASGESHSGASRGVPNATARATIVAAIAGPVPLTVLGTWARGPNYARDVLITLEAHADQLRDSRAIVMGDFNSGSRLGRHRLVTRDHHSIVAALERLGMVSAYHAHHSVEPGNEPDATYFHQFNRLKPWHIDFCFVPRSWQSQVVNVRVIKGRRWAKRSDHRPLLVELELPDTLIDDGRSLRSPEPRDKRTVAVDVPAV